MSITASVWKNELRRRHAGIRGAPEVSLQATIAAVGESVELTAPLFTTTDPDPLQSTLNAERLRTVSDCVAELPPRRQRCLVLHVRGLAYRDIADLLQISVGTVKSHINQARQAIADCVGRRLAGGGA